MAQYGLPDTDDSIINFAEGAGDGDGDTFDEVDEGFGAGRGSGSGPDDATTYWVTTDEGNNNIRCNLTTVTDPEVSTGHLLRHRARKNTSGGRQIDLISQLFHGGSGLSGTIETFADIDNVWTTYTSTIAEAQADLLTNYTILAIESKLEEVGGGTPRIGWLSAQEFECPDAGGPAGRIPDDRVRRMAPILAQ